MRFLTLLQCSNRIDIHHTSFRKLLDKDQTQNNWDQEQPSPIPYVKGISEKIKRICAKERIHVYFSSSRTTGSLLSRVRSCPDPNDTTGVVYCIPCQDCDHLYETGCTLKTRLSEHRRNCRNGEVERSGMAQHTIEEDHRIDWEGRREKIGLKEE